MTVVDLFKDATGGRIAEAEFVAEFFKLFREGSRLSEAEAECLGELVDDVNMAEHVGPLFGSDFVWQLKECMRLLEARVSAAEIRRFFATSGGPVEVPRILPLD